MVEPLSEFHGIDVALQANAMPFLQPVPDLEPTDLFSTAIYDPIPSPTTLSYVDIKSLAGIEADQDVQVVTTVLLRCAGEGQNYDTITDEQTAVARLDDFTSVDLPLIPGKQATLAKAETQLESAVKSKKMNPERKQQAVTAAQQRIEKVSAEIANLQLTLQALTEGVALAGELAVPYKLMEEAVAPYGDEFHRDYGPLGLIDIDRVETDIYVPTDGIEHPSLTLLASLQSSHQGKNMAPPARHLLRYILMQTLPIDDDNQAA